MASGAGNLTCFSHPVARANFDLTRLGDRLADSETDLFLAAICLGFVGGTTNITIFCLVNRTADLTADITVACLEGRLTQLAADIPVTRLEDWFFDRTADISIRRLENRLFDGTADIFESGFEAGFAERATFVSVIDVIDVS